MAGGRRPPGDPQRRYAGGGSTRFPLTGEDTARERSQPHSPGSSPRRRRKAGQERGDPGAAGNDSRLVLQPLLPGRDPETGRGPGMWPHRASGAPSLRRGSLALGTTCPPVPPGHTRGPRAAQRERPRCAPGRGKERPRPAQEAACSNGTESTRSGDLDLSSRARQFPQSVPSPSLPQRMSLH